MSTAILRIAYPTSAPAGALFKYSNPELSIPCAVAIETLTNAQIQALIKQVQTQLNGKLFRDFDLFMDTYQDYKEAVNKPYNGINHVYLRLTLRPDGVLRISADNRPFGDHNGGGTIYDIEQFSTLLNHVTND